MHEPAGVLPWPGSCACQASSTTCPAQLPLQGIPYNDKGQLFHPQPMVYECSGWAGCPHGDKCSQVACSWGDAGAAGKSESFLSWHDALKAAALRPGGRPLPGPPDFHV